MIGKERGEIGKEGGRKEERRGEERGDKRRKGGKDVPAEPAGRAEMCTARLEWSCHKEERPFTWYFCRGHTLRDGALSHNTMFVHLCNGCDKLRGRGLMYSVQTCSNSPFRKTFLISNAAAFHVCKSRGISLMASFPMKTLIRRTINCYSPPLHKLISRPAPRLDFCSRLHKRWLPRNLERIPRVLS